eukprot:Amastigsp_a345486_21.p4 type:complete len:167 gc:universal Amastigsp_a345486_21:1761-1261(-)
MPVAATTALWSVSAKRSRQPLTASATTASDWSRSSETKSSPRAPSCGSRSPPCASRVRSMRACARAPSVMPAVAAVKSPSTVAASGASCPGATAAALRVTAKAAVTTASWHALVAPVCRSNLSMSAAAARRAQSGVHSGSTCAAGSVTGRQSTQFPATPRARVITP